MDLELVLTCVLSSTVAAAIINALKEMLMWFLNRKAKVTDDENLRREDKLQDQLTSQQKTISELQVAITEMKATLGALMENEKIILRDRIKYLVIKYMNYGEITLEEKQAIQHMWNVYHFGLKANGDLDDLMSLLESIPLVRAHSSLDPKDWTVHNSELHHE